MTETSIQEINAVARDAALEQIERGQPVAWLAWEGNDSPIFHPTPHSRAHLHVRYCVRWATKQTDDAWRVHALATDHAVFVEVGSDKLRAAVCASTAILAVTPFMLGTATSARPNFEPRTLETWEERRERILQGLQQREGVSDRMREVLRRMHEQNIPVPENFQRLREHYESRERRIRTVLEELVSVQRELNAVQDESMYLTDTASRASQYGDDARRRHLHERLRQLQGLLHHLDPEREYHREW